VNTKLALSAIALTVAAPVFAQASVTRADFLKANSARFAAIDTNHDGKLDRAEMAAAQQRDLNGARQQLQQQLAGQFQRLDTNKNGSLSLGEFQAAMPNISTAETPDQLLGQLDSNKNGTVSADEFRSNGLGKFNRADTNKDGVISAAEARAVAGKR
jgi:Ca2+-binding EF-hand superfamily protein